MKYDFRNIEKIQEADFCCITSLVEDVLSAFQRIRVYETIDIIANADVITNVLRSLIIANKEFSFGMVDIDGGGFDYTGEYVLSIDDEYKIWVEPVWREGKLINTGAYLTYLHGDCNYRIIKKLDEEDANVLIFDFVDLNIEHSGYKAKL